MSWRRLNGFIEHLPRESATVQAVYGAQMLWGDAEHLQAMNVDAVNHLNWLIARLWAKDAPKTPPDPVRRPTDAPPERTSAENLTGNEQIGGRSMSIEELDRILEAHTGAPHGIAREEV